MSDVIAENIPCADGLIIRWAMEGIGNGVPVRISAAADKSYGMYSNVGGWGGATVTLQGSWDVDNNPPLESSWVTLNESDNTATCSLTANGAGVILENPIWIRPTRTVAGGVQINVVLVGT